MIDMTNVVMMGGVTSQDLDPDMMMQNTMGKLSNVFIIGWDHNDELYIASSKADGPEALWLLEMAKKKLLEVGSE